MPEHGKRRIEEVTVLDPEHYEAIAIDKRSDGIALATRELLRATLAVGFPSNAV